MGGASIPLQRVHGNPPRWESVLSHEIPEGNAAGRSPSLGAPTNDSGLRTLLYGNERILRAFLAGFARRGREMWEP